MLNLSDTEPLKAELVRTIRYLHGKGWAPATSSNYSFREPNHKMYWISKSGIDKQSFADADLMLINSFGIPILETDVRPSAETLLHTLIYEDSTVSCILHTHSIYNTVLSRIYKSNKEIIFSDLELIKALPGVTTHSDTFILPIFQNSQNMNELSEDIRLYRNNNPDMKAFLLSGHGLYSWAESISAAKRHIEAIEFLLECNYKEQIYLNHQNI